jgi:hypothetical protein
LSRLLQLKKWLTLEDAARHIGNLCGEENVAEAEVLQLALEGNLKLSINLVRDTYARPWVAVDPDKIEYLESLPLIGHPSFRFPAKGMLVQHKDGTYYQETRSIVPLKAGIWDLPFIGGERLDVEYERQFLATGEEITVGDLEQRFVCSPEGDLFHLMELESEGHGLPKMMSFPKPNDFHSSFTFPEDSAFVVRTSALAEFVELLRSIEMEEVKTAPEKDVSTRERNGLLSTIAVVCRLAKLDYTKTGKTAEFIVAEAERMGVRLPLSSVKKYLSIIPDALETRMK